MAMDHSHRGKAELLRILKSREITIDDLTDRLAAAEGLLAEVLNGDAVEPYDLIERIDAHLRGGNGR